MINNRSTIYKRTVLAFCTVILFSALVSVIAVTVISRNRYAQFVQLSDKDQAVELAPIIGSFYETTGSWDSVIERLAGNWSAGNEMMDRMMGNMMGNNMMGMGRRPSTTNMMAPMMWMPSTTSVVLADRNSVVVFDSTGSMVGRRLSMNQLGKGEPIRIGNQIIGTLFVGSMIESSLNSPEREFIRSIVLTLVLSMLPVVLLSILYASRFTSRLTGPLVKMKKAASDIATGDLSVRVDSSGIGEIQALATSFNEMGESLQTAVDQRSQLIADISHELRTPLSLIQGSLEAVLDSIYPMNHDTIESIHKQTLHLGALVDDLRSLSLLDVGEVDFDFKAVDLQSIVNEVVLSFDQYSRSKQLQVSQRCSEPLAMASCDPARIYQVLTNLLGNAMRYTPNDGNISIDITAEDESFLHVCVADTGIGIDQDSLEHVFDRFYRSDPSRSRQTGGTGLGLAISAKIIEAHGGKIGVNSEHGFGSSFWFTLPRIL